MTGAKISTMRSRVRALLVDEAVLTLLLKVRGMSTPRLSGAPRWANALRVDMLLGLLIAVCRCVPARVLGSRRMYLYCGVSGTGAVTAGSLNAYRGHMLRVTIASAGGIILTIGAWVLALPALRSGRYAPISKDRPPLVARRTERRGLHPSADIDPWCTPPLARPAAGATAGASRWATGTVGAGGALV